MLEYLDLPYVFPENEAQKLDIFTPDQGGFSTLIWFHGGGIVSGSRKGNDIPCGLVKKGIAVVAAEYRMYPTAKFPDFIVDAANAVAFTVKKIKELGGNGKVFIGGSSAGAYLTMMLCMNKDFLKNAGVNEELDITGFISDSAQTFTHFNVLKEMGMDSRIQYIDQKAPISFINSALTLRPLLMFYYSKDMVCRPEENKLFYASLKRFLPDSDVTLTELEGTHCSADFPDQNGDRRIEPYLFDFISKH
ncbi:MAG: alpha/beta hydrolase [Clostridia bacterium]|nr:alpha/beta hydrolase [Clostridia bacterium]